MDYAVSAFLLNLIYLTVAVFTGWSILRVIDILTNRPFEEAYRDMRGGSTAVGVYYGLRFLGVCIIAAAFLS